MTVYISPQDILAALYNLLAKEHVPIRDGRFAVEVPSPSAASATEPTAAAVPPDHVEWLEGILQRAIAMAAASAPREAVCENGPSPLLRLLDEQGKLRRFHSIEKDIYRFSLHYCRYQMANAARSLGIGRSTLYRKANAFDLTPPRPGTGADASRSVVPRTVPRPGPDYHPDRAAHRQPRRELQHEPA